jgi:hypothetical protein
LLLCVSNDQTLAILSNVLIFCGAPLLAGNLFGGADETNSLSEKANF